MTVRVADMTYSQSKTPNNKIEWAKQILEEYGYIIQAQVVI